MPRELLFVSARFLFPTDSGGKIRTTQILRGLKGGAFRVRLIMPATDQQRANFAREITSVCDALISWSPRERGDLMSKIRRIAALFGNYPVSVASDYDKPGASLIKSTMLEGASVVVFDFPHSAVLAPTKMCVPSVMFTHNVESEIFARHASLATNPLMKKVWASQHSKMVSFEKETLERFDAVVAVSNRDRDFFANEWQISQCASIPTGVDTEYFEFSGTSDSDLVVFCGSMDWMANVDAVQFFHRDVWPLIRQKVPNARMKVVGRTPPDNLIRQICDESPEWEFTGFVDDVRDHVSGAAAFVIPLRVGGGTRIKAFEAMAMGCPVVSTTIGVEGLPLVEGVHYLRADWPNDIADSVVRLLNDGTLVKSVAETARRYVEDNCGFRIAAKEFEDICLETLSRKSN